MRLGDFDNFSDKFNSEVFNKLQNDYLNSSADNKTKEVADFVVTEIMVIFNNLIDNAPTVEPDMEFAKWVAKMIFDNGVEDFDFELFSELACRKLEKLGLVKKTESKWIKK